MASILDLSASSDSEDVDYIPSTKVLASDSNDEEFSEENEDFDSGELLGKKKKTKKGSQKAEDKDSKIKSDFTAKVAEKQHAKELWETFLNDVESVTPKKSNSVVVNGNNAIPNESEIKAPKIDIKTFSEVFEFAGEKLCTAVDKDLNSCDVVVEKNSERIPKAETFSIPKKRGINSVLGTILNKNKKLTVLEKSVLDWKNFKKDEGLDNELEKVNKGKQGFIERQRFLQRSDLRSFEMEKSMRQTLRKK